MKILIFGGTFNPIHNGHLIMAEIALEKFCLDKVLFIPCYMPPHKSAKSVAPAKDRLSMVKLAVKKCPEFAASDIEIKRGGRSYSIDTVRALIKKYGKTAELYFLIGSDSLRDFNSWVEADELARLCKFVVYERPDVTVPSAMKRLGHNKKHFTRFISDFPVGISSTNIRKMAKSAKSIRYLVPKGVEEYIHKNRLYL